MNRGPRSKTKLLGIPWSFLTMSINKSVEEFEVWRVGNMSRWMPFEKRSTTNTKVVMCPQYADRPMIKSRERSSHGKKGTSTGQSKPTAFWVSYFVCWQSIEVVIKSSTSFRIPCQVKFSLRRARVLATPMCPPVGDEWYSMSRVRMKCDPSVNQIRPPFRIKSWAIE